MNDMREEAVQALVDGIAGGGWCDDTVDWNWQEAAEAYRRLYEQEIRKRDRAGRALNDIRALDRTPRYDYAEPRRDGVMPETGARWLTPRERAEDALKAMYGEIPTVF